MSDTTTSGGSCSCLGCLVSIVALIGTLWILFHLNEIALFITG